MDIKCDVCNKESKFKCISLQCGKYLCGDCKHNCKVKKIKKKGKQSKSIIRKIKKCSSCLNYLVLYQRKECKCNSRKRCCSCLSRCSADGCDNTACGLNRCSGLKTCMSCGKDELCIFCIAKHRSTCRPKNLKRKMVKTPELSDDLKESLLNSLKSSKNLSQIEENL